MVQVTISQFSSEMKNKHNNLKKMIEKMKEAKSQNADLIVFPEMCLTGYYVWNSLQELAESLEGDSIIAMQNACKEIGIHVVFSFPEQNAAGDFYITAALINDEGEIAGVYRKTHLFDQESTVFKGGDTLPVFDTKFGKVGIMICYDLEFPEVARTLRLKGAQLLIVPLANMTPYEEYQLTYSRSRAMENQIPVVICNRTGYENETNFFGESVAISANGEILAKLDHEENSITVDIELNESLDEKLSYVSNRRVDLYER